MVAPVGLEPTLCPSLLIASSRTILDSSKPLTLSRVHCSPSGVGFANSPITQESSIPISERRYKPLYRSPSCKGCALPRIRCDIDIHIVRIPANVASGTGSSGARRSFGCADTQGVSHNIKYTGSRARSYQRVRTFFVRFPYYVNKRGKPLSV